MYREVCRFQAIMILNLSRNELSPELLVSSRAIHKVPTIFGEYDFSDEQPNLTIGNGNATVQHGCVLVMVTWKQVVPENLLLRLGQN